MKRELRAQSCTSHYIQAIQVIGKFITQIADYYLQKTRVDLKNGVGRSLIRYTSIIYVFTSTTRICVEVMLKAHILLRRFNRNWKSISSFSSSCKPSFKNFRLFENYLIPSNFAQVGLLLTTHKNKNWEGERFWIFQLFPHNTYASRSEINFSRVDFQTCSSLKKYEYTFSTANQHIS